MAQKRTSGSAKKKRPASSAGGSGRAPSSQRAQRGGQQRSSSAKKGKTVQTSRQETKRPRKIRQVAPPRERNQRRKGRHRLLYTLVSVILIAAALVGGSIVFFKVDTVTAVGNEHYTEEQIVQASGIQGGENLFLLNKKEVRQRLASQLPYLKGISIHWKLPSTVSIRVEESQPVAALEVSNGWWYMDASGRLLEFADEPGSLVQVSGLNLLTPSAGTDVAVDTNYQLKRDGLIQLLTAMEEQGLLGDAETIDLSGSADIIMGYGERFTVKLRLGSDFDYKMRTLTGVLENLSENERGTIDLTMDNESHFIPG